MDAEIENVKNKKKNKGQVTIFIIIGIVVIALALLFVFVFNKGTGASELPVSVQPVYTTFLSCLEEDIGLGIGLLEDQGGYIELPEFEPGSFYSPFSSQLNFFGTDIPYWYYLSQNNLQKEQVPSKRLMEEQLADFVADRIERCNLDAYYSQGFSIKQGEPTARTVIRDGEVEVNLNMRFSIDKNTDSVFVDNHKVIFKSNLGSLYNSAFEIYKKEQQEMLLEQYGLDIMGLYAPVEGVEFSCSPLTWNANDVFTNLEEAIEINTLALGTSGDGDEYFRVKGIDADVRFVNSRNWTKSFEVSPSEGPLMISTPVGNQPGLGILGFCYVDYHYVYNLMYPVVIQVREGDETFQFPVSVIIKGNRPREPYSTNAVNTEIPEFCKYMNTNFKIRVYDTQRRPVDADISYECSNTNCYIGKSDGGVIEADFPQCVNGRILARAEGYADKKEIISIVSSGVGEIYLDKIYSVNVLLKLDGRPYTKGALVSFISNDSSSKTIYYPEQKTIDLIEGEYQVQVQMYKNSTLKLGSSVREQCVDVPRGALGGLFGLTKKRCFNVEVPEQIISNALAGGGKQTYYVSSTQLQTYDKVEINAPSLPDPDSLEQLQANYLLYEGNSLEVRFA